MDTEDIQERAILIAKLKAMGFNYKFENYQTKQLKMIYVKSMKARNKICQEIADLGSKVGDKYNLTNLYNSRLNIDNLRGLKSRLEKEYHRLLVANQIMEYADILDKDQDFIVENMFLGHKSTEDLEDVLFKLQKEIFELEKESTLPKKDTINYDVSFAMGDDPILDQTDYNLVVPTAQELEKAKRYLKKKKKK